MEGPLLVSAISLLLIMIVLYYFRKDIKEWLQFWQQLGKLPGTTTVKPYFILGHLVHGFVPYNELLGTIARIWSENPPVVFIWFGPFPALGVRKAKALETVLSSPKCTDKAIFYNFLSPWLGDGLLLSGGKKWHDRRKLLTPAFHFKILENFVEIFAKNTRVLVKNMAEEIDSKGFDVCPYISMCTLDVICETAMGIEIKAQILGEESEYVHAVCKITVEIMKRIMTPWLYLDFIYYLSPPGRRFKKYVTTLHNFTTKVVRERMEATAQADNTSNSQQDDTGIKKRKAFLDLLLESMRQGENLTEQDIREEVDTFMFEGHDTTTSALSWALQLLGRHPDIQENAYKELNEVFQGSNRDVTTHDLKDMKYLERIIKETLRLYPPVPVLGRNLKEDMKIDGHMVPAGVSVGTSIHYVHRSPEHFPDPDTFNPDNFLPEKIAERHPFVYIPFSAGPRNCIGQKFAMLEMKTILSSILRSYKVIAIGDNPKPIPELIMRPENGVHIKIIPRTTNN